MAQAEYPNDPIRRSIALRTHLPDRDGFRGLRESTIPFEIWEPRLVNRNWRRFYRQSIETNAWVVPKTRSGNWPSLRALPDYELNTIRYAGVKDVRHNRGLTYEVPFPEKGRDFSFKGMNFEPNRRSQLTVDWAAGLTCPTSNSGRVFDMIRLMNSDRLDGLTMDMLRNGQQPYFFQTSAVTADRPFHGSGPSDLSYFSLAGSLEWRERYYRKLRESGQTGLAVGSRSGESLYIGELNARKPGFFNGMIWMSPMHPTVGYHESIEGYREDAVLTGVPINPMAFRWFTETRNEMVGRADSRWWESERPTGDTPLLILVGELDLEVSAATRAEFRRWAQRSPETIFYVEVPGAGHDVFSVTEDTDGNKRRWTQQAEVRAARAWQYVYWFLRSQVLKEKNVAVPSHGWLINSGA
jgi:hypothetical protein